MRMRRSIVCSMLSDMARRRAVIMSAGGAAKEEKKAAPPRPRARGELPTLPKPPPPRGFRGTLPVAVAGARRGDAEGVLDAELIRESRNLLGHGNRSAMVCRTAK
jgi:hypothetical protein